MFDANSCDGFLVEQGDPLEGALFRSGENSSLETKVVVNDSIITGKEVRAAHKTGPMPLSASARPTKTKALMPPNPSLRCDRWSLRLPTRCRGLQTTWAYSDTTFRTTRDGAVSYFVGGDKNFDDLGLHWQQARSSNRRAQCWKKSWFDRSVMRLDGRDRSGVHVHQDEDGNVGYVDKTWAYQKDDAGTVRIVLHHSSSRTIIEDPRSKNRKVDNQG